MLKWREFVSCILIVLLLIGTESIVLAKTTITWWTLGPREGAEEIKQVYEKKNPDVSVEVLILPSWDDLWKKLMVSVAGGVTPDVVRGKDYWVVDLASRKALLPLDDVIEKNKKEILGMPPERIYTRRIYDLYTYQGRIYALPFHNFWPVLVYNENLFKEAGLRRAPRTFEEFREFGIKLTKPEKKQWGTMLYTYTRLEPTLVLWSFYVYSLQNKAILVKVAKETGEPTFLLDAPESVNTLQWIVDNIYRYKFCTPPEAISPNMIENEKVAMWITGQFSFGGYDRTMPPNVKWAVAPIPTNIEKAIFTEGNALFIPAGTKNKEAAIEFAKFASGKEADLIWSKWSGTMPFRDSNLAKPPYSNMPRYVVSANEMKTYKLVFPQYFPGYTEVMSKVAESLQAAFYNKMSPLDAMKKAQADAASMVKK